MRVYTGTSTAIPTEGFLSAAEQIELISAAQNVPLRVIDRDPEGGETFAFGRTPESDAAITRLVAAFAPLIRSMARTPSRLDYDEAEAICYERFLRAVREHDLSSHVPFSRDIRTMLRYELADRSRTSDVIQVKQNVAARYLRLLREHDHDVLAAYEECRTTPNGLDPHTFLAVHRAHVASISLDTTSALNESESSAYTNAQRRLVDQTASTFDEDLANRDLVQWLFTKVSAQEEKILRLRYGFRDLSTENLRWAAGFNSAESDPVMSDREVAQCLGLTRPTCDRYRRQALATMRAELDDLAAESD